MSGKYNPNWKVHEEAAQGRASLCMETCPFNRCNDGKKVGSPGMYGCQSRGSAM